MKDMSEQEKVETRAMTIFYLALAGNVHVMARDGESADAHFELMSVIGERLGVAVVKLHAAPNGESEGNLRAYSEGDVVVGRIGAFLYDFDLSLPIRRDVAFVEGESAREARKMLAGYREVRHG